MYLSATRDAKPTRVQLGSHAPDMTVAEMRARVREVLGLASQDFVLLVVGLPLLDHWTGREFGLKPVTNVDLRFGVVARSASGASTSPVTPTKLDSTTAATGFDEPEPSASASASGATPTSNSTSVTPKRLETILERNARLEARRLASEREKFRLREENAKLVDDHERAVQHLTAEFERKLHLVEAERDALKGELEAVRAGAHVLADTSHSWEEERAALRAQVERLKRELALATTVTSTASTSSAKKTPPGTPPRSKLAPRRNQRRAVEEDGVVVCFAPDSEAVGGSVHVDESTSVVVANGDAYVFDAAAVVSVERLAGALAQLEWLDAVLEGHTLSLVVLGSDAATRDRLMDGLPGAYESSPRAGASTTSSSLSSSSSGAGLMELLVIHLLSLATSAVAESAGATRYDFFASVVVVSPEHTSDVLVPGRTIATEKRGGVDGASFKPVASARDFARLMSAAIAERGELRARSDANVPVVVFEVRRAGGSAGRLQFVDLESPSRMSPRLRKAVGVGSRSSHTAVVSVVTPANAAASARDCAASIALAREFAGSSAAASAASPASSFVVA